MQTVRRAFEMPVGLPQPYQHLPPHPRPSLGKYCGELALRIGKSATATNRPAKAYQVASFTILLIYLVDIFSTEA